MRPGLTSWQGLKANNMEELIARLSNPPVDSELGQVLQMAAAGELY
jgi:hypothetical protein